MLYQLEMNTCDADTALKSFWDSCEQTEETKLFTEELVKGIIRHKKKIDAVIRKTAANWSFNRITPIDRSILRTALYEMFFCPEIPYRVTLNEAIELGKKYGTEKSSAFINGVLDSVVNHHPSLKASQKQLHE